MYGVVSNLAMLLDNERVLYLPTCVVLEGMTTTYGQLSRLPVSGRLSDEALAYAASNLERYLKGLKSATRAYSADRVKMFPGDWRTDRIKAGDIFGRMMEKAQKVYHRSFNPYRQEIGETIWELRKEWEAFFTLLDQKIGYSSDTRTDTSCRYFRSNEITTWQQTMANIILHLHESAEYEDSDVYLMLLCNNRVKSHLVRQIEIIQQKAGIGERFDEDRLACISEMECRKTCPSCLSFSQGNAESVRKSKPMLSCAVPRF